MSISFNTMVQAAKWSALLIVPALVANEGTKRVLDLAKKHHIISNTLADKYANYARGSVYTLATLFSARVLAIPFEGAVIFNGLVAASQVFAKHFGVDVNFNVN